MAQLIDIILQSLKCSFPVQRYYDILYYKKHNDIIIIDAVNFDVYSSSDIKLPNNGEVLIKMNGIDIHYFVLEDFEKMLKSFSNKK